MKPTIDMYPVFEANQVLTNNHLNQVFNYLDEQERLGRANLIGIGIVCGLEITRNGNTSILLSRGCGVTSQGYLIVEPEDVDLVSYRADYTIPLELSYPPFRNNGAQYPLWELFPVGEPNTQTLASTPTFLNDKVVVLFLELKKDDLSNCSPNNCDDKGAEITATVRRLLMRKQDAAAMVAAANGLGDGHTQSDLTATMQARLNLPDLRLPRYDVSATKPATSLDVLSAFYHVFQQSGFVSDTRSALYAAYQAFRPLLEDGHPTNPFTGFLARYDFLEKGPTTEAQVRFLQYYYDLFDDIVKAYDEFRWKGVDVMCACCPPEGLFPRHLILGPDYRHTFLASAALGRCEERIAELRVLFDKLVLMVSRFTNAPNLPQQPPRAKIDGQIRITPSKLADVPLSAKAIPYYYDHDGQPPIRDVWNPDLTRWKRANRNLGYWSSDYMPAPPSFVRNPLGFDLEPYNFLRIEGHLGKNYGQVLTTLLSLKDRHRLPIDVIALRTGQFDEKMTVDLSKEECRFRDLETLYDALRDELLCSLRKTIRGLAIRPFQPATHVVSKRASTAPPVTEKVDEAPADEFRRLFVTEQNSYGAFIEKLIREQGIDHINAAAERPMVNAVVNSVGLLYKFALLLRKDLFEVDWVKFDELYEALKRWSEDVTVRRNQADGDTDLSWRDLDTELANVIFACRLEAFKSLREEYASRVREVKQKQYFSHFIDKNPGIQHKAGVPIGGTFIIVYHQADDEVAGGRLVFGSDRSAAEETDRTMEALRKKKKIAEDPDVNKLMEELMRMRRAAPGGREIGGRNVRDNRIFETFVSDLADGTVIADFFVPYLCCADCMPVQYVLSATKPEEPTEPLAFTTTRTCTDAHDMADVTITATGGVPPYQVIVNAQAPAPLTGAIPIPAGTNTIVVVDSTGNRTAPMSETIPAQLTTGQLQFTDDPAKGVYDVTFRMIGGTAPYTSTKGTVTGDTCTIMTVKSDDVVSVDIADARGCKTSLTIQHTVGKGCDKPCDGRAERWRYLLWLPKPVGRETFIVRGVKSDDFIIVDETGKQHAIPGIPSIVAELFDPQMQIDENNYDEIMSKLANRMNEAVVEALGPDVFIAGYDPKEPGIITFESYVCHSFMYQLAMSILSNDVVREERWMYNDKGTFIRQPDGEIQDVIRFGRVVIDKCAGIIVSEAPRSDVEIGIEGGTVDRILTPKYSPALAETNIRFSWRAEGNLLIVSKEPRAKVSMKMRIPFRIRHVANERNGGWAYIEEIVGGKQLDTRPASPTRPVSPTRKPR